MNDTSPFFAKRLLAQVIVSLVSIVSSGAAVSAAQCPESGEKQVFWGDLHVHTAFSMDAYVVGNRRTPEDAYAFARGAPDKLPDGSTVRLDRPLDFAAVTDHGEYLAAMNICGQQSSDVPYCEELRKVSDGTSPAGFLNFFLPALLKSEPICPTDAEDCARAGSELWQRLQQAAADAYEPCRFTTFIGTEWSKSPDVLHWHRNLIYANTQVPSTPINSVDQPTQEALWDALNATCPSGSGCRVLAIPHNSNIGMGGTFRTDENDVASMRLRARFERLAEVFQHKGQSECYPGSTLADEACRFEIMLPVPISRSLADEPRALTADEERAIASGYLRQTLGRGLLLEAKTGVNPFHYGLIASTDTHAARPGYVEEAGWQGTFGPMDATREGRGRQRQYNPGGLVAVWARANDRPHLFDALDRREVYATSGPRIVLRFQQSFDPTLDLCAGDVPAAVHMGGSIDPGASQPPRFGVQVLADRVPLTQIDIVKLTVRDGEIEQSIASEKNPGRKDWCVDWADDEYDPSQPTLWYARVLERPTPRWSAELGDTTVQSERAWTSPIWSVPVAEDR